MSTKVIFRRDRSASGVVFAMLPQDAGTNSPYTCMIFTQHGHTSGDVRDNITSSRLAIPEEYADLKLQMERAGYDDLKIGYRATRHDLEIRKAQLR